MDNSNQGDQSGGTGGGIPADTNVPAGGTYTPPSPAEETPVTPAEGPAPEAPVTEPEPDTSGGTGGSGIGTPTGTV